MTSPLRRCLKLGFTALAIINLSFFAACSKTKSALDTTSGTSCDPAVSVCDSGTGTGLGTGAGTATGTSTGTSSGIGLGTGTGSGSSNLLNPNLTNNDLSKGTNQSASSQTQAACYSNLSHNNQYGQGYQGSNPYGDMSNLGGTSNSAPGYNGTGSCLAKNATPSAIANLGLGTLQADNTCVQTAFSILNALEGQSAPTVENRKLVAIFYIRCKLKTVRAQASALNWDPNNQTAFGATDYYLSNFLQQIHGAF